MIPLTAVIQMTLMRTNPMIATHLGGAGMMMRRSIALRLGALRVITPATNKAIANQGGLFRSLDRFGLSPIGLRR